MWFSGIELVILIVCQTKINIHASTSSLTVTAIILPPWQVRQRTCLLSAATCWMSIWRAKARWSVSGPLPSPHALKILLPISYLQKAPAMSGPWTVSSSSGTLCPKTRWRPASLARCLTKSCVAGPRMEKCKLRSLLQFVGQTILALFHRGKSLFWNPLGVLKCLL